MISQRVAAASSDSLLDESLRYAIQLLRDSDESLGRGTFPVDPDVVVWMLEQRNPELADSLKKQQILVEFRESLRVLRQLRAKATEHHQDLHFGMENEIAHDIFDDEYGRPTLEEYQYVLRQDSDAYRGASAARVVQLFLDGLASEEQFYAPLRASCMECDDDSSSDGSRGPMPFQVTYQVGRPCSEALAYATGIMARLDDGTDPHFWSNVDVRMQFGGIPAESFEESQALEAERDAFFCTVIRHVRRMERVEYHWDRLGQPLRRLLASSPITAGEALALIERMLRIDDTEDGDRDPSLSTEVWKMIRRRIGKPAWYPHPHFR
ncbi:hypothetical protein P5W98_00795 [Paraburkholderia sp. A1BS-2L]|uniref:hypothetical protein n=1 Tax=Paraburkholderia sp. A1BS-2L TaxID=3028373 RepID=UPI003DA8D797